MTIVIAEKLDRKLTTWDAVTAQEVKTPVASLPAGGGAKGDQGHGASLRNSAETIMTNPPSLTQAPPKASPRRELWRVALQFTPAASRRALWRRRVKHLVAEIIDLADADGLDLLRSRQVEQEVMVTCQESVFI